MTLVIEFNDASTSSTLQSSSSSSSDSIFTHYQSAFTNVLSSVNATPRLFSLRVHSGRLTVWDIQKGRTLQTEFEHVADDGRLKVCPSDECLGKTIHFNPFSQLTPRFLLCW